MQKTANYSIGKSFNELLEMRGRVGRSAQIGGALLVLAFGKKLTFALNREKVKRGKCSRRAVQSFSTGSETKIQHRRKRCKLEF